jgi:hypothetical protein
LDRPPDRWFQQLGLSVPRETVSGGRYIAISIAVAVALGAFFFTVPFVVDFLASRIGARVRFVPLPLFTGAIAVFGLYVLIRAIRGEVREEGRNPLERFLRSRGGTGVVGVILLVPAAWFAWLGINDVAQPPIPIVVNAVAVGCGRSSYFRTEQRLFYVALGTGLPCSLQMGRYQLIVGAGTNTVSSFLRLP